VVVSRKRAQGNSPGPWGWENAKGWADGQPSQGALEITCYTDVFQPSVNATGGPYTVLSPDSIRLIPDRRPGSPQIGLILRVEQYVPHAPGEWLDNKWNRNAERELAALLSLVLGIRLRAGGITRYFHPADDSHGVPLVPDIPPYLPFPEMFPVLPYTSQGCDADSARVTLLDSYASMTAEQASALVRSARSYQEAIWIADGDPRQAWLRLVTAVEAITWFRSTEKIDPLDRLSEVHPDIAERVSRADDLELTEWITRRFVDQDRSTKKFVEFLTEFKPPPRPRRPRAGQRLDWTIPSLSKQFRTIYDYRSKDLHQGNTFPESMCQPPLVSRSGIVSEAVHEPPPRPASMCLQIFEYIVRNALQSWWRSITEGVDGPKPASRST
jgi:hypothetical protein